MCVCVCESELPVEKPTALTDSSTFIFFVLPVNPPHPPLTPPSASLTTFDGFTAVIQEVAAQSCTLRSSELQALSDGQETGVKRTETRLKQHRVKTPSAEVEGSGKRLLFCGQKYQLPD